jgi:hypothetical protein
MFASINSMFASIRQTLATSRKIRPFCAPIRVE